MDVIQRVDCDFRSVVRSSKVELSEDAGGRHKRRGNSRHQGAAGALQGRQKETRRAVERRGKNDAAGESNGGDRVSKSLNAAWGGRDAGGTGLDKMVRQSIEKADMPVKEALGGTGAGTSIYKAIGFLSMFFRLIPVTVLVALLS